MLRTLKHYWPVNLAVVAGAAVATAVLTGALLVGDSVRESLAALTLERLGGVHSALASARFFREELAAELPDTAPAIVLRGSASHEGGLRASRVGIHGIDARFFELSGVEPWASLNEPRGQLFPPAVLNQALSRALGVEAGDTVLLRFGRSSDVPRDTLMGDADVDAVAGSLRVTVAEIVPDSGMGRFGLTPTQQTPLNAFVALDRLQRALGVRGEVNALLAGKGLGEPARALARTAELEDRGLTLERQPAFVELGSREFVLAPQVVNAAHEVAASLGAPAQNTQAYLANSLRIRDRSLPYALVAALDPRPGSEWASLTLVDGRPAPPIGPDGILLNAWAVADLEARVGAEVELTYFVVGPREELREETTRLVLEGVVAIAGLGADRGLTPEYPGIRETRDMSDWDPPFPVDLGVIRSVDEDYWDEHGATPKAFVSEATGQRLWATRHGHVTAVRIGAARGDLAGTEQAFRQALLSRLEPSAFGLSFEPVREQGLAAASGATDFGQLFLAFSFFLIVSAALLVGLLFRLGTERRAAEIGLLLAVGHRVQAVRSRLLGEGAVLAVAGGLVGSIAGVGYAAAMMAGLRTLWRPAVGSSELHLHVVPASLATGFSIALVVVVISIVLAVRKLVRVAPPRLLAGSVLEPVRRPQGRGARILAFGAAAAAVALVAYGVLTGAAASPALAFGSGSLLLVSGLASFSLWCSRRGHASLGNGTRALAAMAARNSAWVPGRSILSVCLVASASFVIGVVAASRIETDERLSTRESGTGGFSLVAEADVPLHHDLGSPRGRAELGLDERAGLFEGVVVEPFRVRSGDDASCLNLYRPRAPRLLGATSRFIERAGFEFQQHAELGPGVTDPWKLLERPLEPGVVPAIADANSARWILHLGLGDDVVVEDEAGRPLRLRLVGLLSRSVFQSELVIAEGELLEHFPSASGDAYFLIDAPAERAAELVQVLEVGLDPFGFDVMPTADRLAGYRVVENTYMATFQFLGGLGLLLGTIGLGVVLVRNVIERRGELAMLRAFGFRRAILAGLVLAENAFLLFVGLGIGVLAALAAAAPRIVAAPPPWGSLVLMLTLVIATGMLASAAAVALALRVPMLPALKAER